MELFYEILDKTHNTNKKIVLFTDSIIKTTSQNITVKKLREYTSITNVHETYVFFITEYNLGLTKDIIKYLNKLNGKNILLQVPKHFDYDYFIKNINSPFVDSFKRNIKDVTDKTYFIYSSISNI